MAKPHRDFEAEKRDYERKISFLMRRYLAIVKKEQKWRRMNKT